MHVVEPGRTCCAGPGDKRSIGKYPHSRLRRRRSGVHQGGVRRASASAVVTSLLAPAGATPSKAHVCLSAQVSLLNCLVASVPARERVITCEEVFELQASPPNVTAAGGSRPSLQPRRVGRRLPAETETWSVLRPVISVPRRKPGPLLRCGLICRLPRRMGTCPRRDHVSPGPWRVASQ